MDLDKAIKERHSCRRFSSKKVDYRDIMAALDAARLAPLAGNISTIKFLVVQDQETIRKLADAAQQNFVAQSSCIVVFCSDPERLEKVYGERGLRYSRQQIGASIQNFLLKITQLGLATCWVGAFVDDEVKRVLQIPEFVEVEAFFPVGYEMPPKSKQRPKPDLELSTYFESYNNRYMNKLISPRA